MKKVCKAALEGIYLSAVMFVIVCMIKGFSSGGETMFLAYSGIAVIVIGAGFGIPSLIYGTELPTAIKVLIHMGTGCIVMLATSLVIGWIDFSRGWKVCLLYAALQIAVAFILWLLTCVQTRKDAKEMNEVIEKKD